MFLPASWLIDCWLTWLYHFHFRLLLLLLASGVIVFLIGVFLVLLRYQTVQKTRLSLLSLDGAYDFYDSYDSQSRLLLDYSVDAPLYAMKAKACAGTMRLCQLGVAQLFTRE